MKNFLITLEKLGRFGNDKDGYTLEPDDNTIVWKHEKQFSGIIKAFEWVKRTHPKLGLNSKSIDKLDPYNYRYYVSNDVDNSDLSAEDMNRAWQDFQVILISYNLL